MGAQECFDKMYATLTYISPPRSLYPVDCKQIKFTKAPEIVFTIQEADPKAILWQSVNPARAGVNYLCSVVSIQEAGALILLLQVSAYIIWQIEFMGVRPQSTPAPWAPGGSANNPAPEFLRYDTSAQPQLVSELQAVFVSLPVFFKIVGPRMLLTASSPWFIKVPYYMAEIRNVFRKLEELEEPLALIQSFKKGFCPADVKALEGGLKTIEERLNAWIRRMRHHADEGDIAMRMRHNIDSTGRFAGSPRLA